MGLQFHIEAAPESVAALVDNAGADIDGGRWQQEPARIRDCARDVAATRPLLDALLNYLTRN